MISAQMQRHGWRIIPVNPHVESLFGQRVHATLATVSEPIDIVLVFRPSAEAAAVARQAAEIGANALWLQSGIVSTQARRIADDAGIDYIEDRCIAVIRAAYELRRSLPAAGDTPS